MTPRRPAHRHHRLLAALALALAAAISLAPARVAAQAPDTSASAEGDETRPPRLFATWHAPHGMPGATSNLMTPCGDTTQVDTLFLSFAAGRYTRTFIRVDAALLFYPQQGDTLLPFWFFKRDWPNAGNKLIDFESQSAVIGTVPWPNGGAGHVSYDHRSGRGRLDLVFVGDRGGAGSLTPSEEYVLARVRIRHRRTDLAGCSQPVCIELAEAQLKFIGQRPMIISSGAERFATWNSPDGSVCKPYLSHPLVLPWLPGR